MSKTVNARGAALETLVRCRRDGAWSGAAIDNTIKKYELNRRDAALASKLCLGVLQNSALCDFYIRSFCTAKLEPKVRDILRMGVYQLLFLDRIPARAAVNESVALCRDEGCARASGLVNAVLRKIADKRDALPEIPDYGSPEYLSVKYSHPLWLTRYMTEHHGNEFAEAFFAANNMPAQLGIQINTLKISTEDYVRALRRADIEFTQKEECDGSLELNGGAASELPGFEDGLFYVQDAAARTAVRLAELKPRMSVLDACSCPGGKSFAAALDMHGEGEILSCDISEKKLRLVKSGAERLGIGIISVRAMDAREHDAGMDEGFDVVIADVPCSGIGVIRKKPEIRQREREAIAALPEIQSEILDNLSRYVKRGGVLLYSTCTVLKEENEDVVSAFLSKHPGFIAEAISCAGIEEKSGMHTFWPNVDGTDGFFAAKLRKIN